MPPSNEREQKPCQIFAMVLGISELSVRDNFVALGGDSIAALACVARAAKAGLRFTVQELFSQSTIEALARCATVGSAVSDLARPRATSAEPHPAENLPAEFLLSGLPADELATLAERVRGAGGGAIEDLYPLSPMQAGMVFHTLP